MREELNAAIHLVRAGCAWRVLPHDFPPGCTAHYYYRRFRLAGLPLLARLGIREGMPLCVKQIEADTTRPPLRAVAEFIRGDGNP